MKKLAQKTPKNPRKPLEERDFDLILYGATGYTGYLIARYLVEHYGLNRPGDPIRWAIAGRNLTKLEILEERLHVWVEVESLANSNKIQGDGTIEMIVTDSSNSEELHHLAQRTRVMIAAVGPYLKYGLPLVEACVAEGTDYLDLSGETPFIRESIDQFHAAAQQRGVRIVHGCGFDAIPSDLGTLVLQEHFINQYDKPAPLIQTVVWSMAGSGISSGTTSSITNLFDWADEHPEKRDLLNNSYALNDDTHGIPKFEEITGMRYDEHLDTWLGPLPTSLFNEQIVRRSNELLEFIYGRSFIYLEALRSPEIVKSGECGTLERVPPGLGHCFQKGVNSVAAGIYSVGVKGLTHLINYKTPRGILRNFSIFIASYPGIENLLPGHLKMIFSARDEDREYARLTIDSNVEPGYTGAAVMISEAAVLLAKERDKLSPLTGVLTPAATFGTLLRKPLEASGHFTFTIKDVS